MAFMPKLVRDGIPGKIRANGEVPVTRVLGDAEFAEATRKKVAKKRGSSPARGIAAK